MNRQGPLKTLVPALTTPTIATMDFGERPWRPVVVDVSLLRATNEGQGW